MKIGMPTLVELENLEENLKLCQALSLDFIELNMNLPEYTTAMDVQGVKSLLEQYRIEATLHIGERIDICEFDPILRAGTLKHLEHVFELAKQLDVKRVNMHMSAGIHFKLPKERVMLYERFEREYMDAIESFCAFAEDYDLLICLENTGILNHGFIQKGMARLLESETFALTYDIGHDISSGYKDRDFYGKYQEKIKHYHIHDGDKDKNHQPLFTGELDIPYYIKKVKASTAYGVIEVKSVEDLKASIEALKRKNLI